MTQNNFKKYIKYIQIFLISMLTTFILEHGGKRLDTVRPSCVINYTSNRLINFFHDLGYLWAMISSFLTFLNFSDMYESLCILLESLLKLLTSPVYFFDGYYEYLKDNLYPILIISGSFAIMISLYFLIKYRMYLCNKYFKRQSMDLVKID